MKNNPNTFGYDMVVFCHLRWDFVYQRPQHLLSRLSKEFNILVVEEPVHYEHGEKDSFNLRKETGNVHIFQPRVDHISEIGPVLKRFLGTKSVKNGWFYSAAFIPVLDHISFDFVIYDCMDELTLFKGASQELINQEDELLKQADVVFTGGKSLYEAKQSKHHNVHCFPSSVDIDHFSNVDQELQKPHDLENISNAIVGYYGVIDERIDLDLIKDTAHLMPEIDFVMIGPICKIGEEDLPRASNIHYLGMKSYDELPNYLQYFDIAMMPFALNDSTKFISPTKTLEYMSAKKPIISTKIKDVERDFKNDLHIIATADEFAEAIEKSIKGETEIDYSEILENTSWDKTVEKMNMMITKVNA